MKYIELIQDILEYVEGKMNTGAIKGLQIEEGILRIAFSEEISWQRIVIAGFQIATMFPMASVICEAFTYKDYHTKEGGEIQEMTIKASEYEKDLTILLSFSDEDGDIAYCGCLTGWEKDGFFSI